MGDDARVATAAGGWRFQGETAEKFGEVAFAGDSMLTLDPDGAALLFHEGAVSVGADPGRVLEDCRLLFGS